MHTWQSDTTKEYFSTNLHRNITQNGIIQHYFCVDTPYQNGIILEVA